MSRPHRQGAELDSGAGAYQAELADLVLGRHPGRTSDEEITIFRSLGLAIEDVAAAGYVFQKALEQGSGAWAQA